MYARLDYKQVSACHNSHVFSNAQMQLMVLMAELSQMEESQSQEISLRLLVQEQILWCVDQCLLGMMNAQEKSLLIGKDRNSRYFMECQANLQWISTMEVLHVIGQLRGKQWKSHIKVQFKTLLRQCWVVWGLLALT